jgi:hypothetical protein
VILTPDEDPEADYGADGMYEVTQEQNESGLKKYAYREKRFYRTVDEKKCFML